MPAPDLSSIADDLEAEATKAEARGERESAMAMLWAALAVRRLLEPHAVVDIERLTRDNVDRRLPRDMEATHRGSISKAHLDHPMMVAARAKGIQSLGDLAKALGYDAGWGKGFISRALKGDKKLPTDKQAKFRELTGKSWKV